MESFWQIVQKWEPMGQGIFFLIVLGGFFTAVASIARAIAVCFRGWPPPYYEEAE